FGAWFIYKRRKMAKEEGLALTSGVSAFLGVTEPAMFGVNLPLKVPFFAAICTSSVLGAIIGANRVLGNVGVGGVPAFISIQSKYWYIYGPVTLLAIIVPAILTVIFSKFTNIKAKKMVENPENVK
ncbi:MAG: hypothetical protein E6658_08745, partial [Veillonella sp.]|nr:hypothetical protein [Veillonella sp.]